MSTQSISTSITADVEHRQTLPSGIIVTVYAESPYMRDFFPRFLASNHYGHLYVVDPWVSLRYSFTPPFAEVVLRCEEMNIWTCTCWGVKEAAPEGDRLVLINPECRVHQIVRYVPLW